MPDATDNKVLSQLMLLQGTLDSMPTDGSISRFVFRGLKSVPGVSYLNVCIRGVVAEKNDLCASCNYRWGEAEDSFDYLCKLKDDGNTKYLPIRTADRLYGFVVFSLNDTPDAFTPYEPYLQNIVNVIAISIDNRRQRQVLEAFNKQLQIEVEQRKQMAEALKESELKFRTLFEDSIDAIYITTKEGMFLDFNRGYLELFGYTKEEMFTIHAKDTYIHPADRDMFKKTMEEEGSVRDYEVKLRRKDGQQMDCIITATTRYADDGSISGYQGIIKDITERKYLEEKLQTISLTDELTGLYNRRGFFTLAQQQMKVTERTKKDMLLFFVDLDKMKQINDTLGHHEGDKALVEIATILKEVFRESDIIGRMGGDEFAILAIDTTDETREVLIMRLHNSLEAHNKLGDTNYQLSLSIGVAHYNPETPSTLDELMAQADTLMYEEKRGK